MELKEILTHCDHTILSQTATWEEVKEVLSDAIHYSCASACIPPCFVRQAKEFVGEKLKICTVIGFPNGYSSTAVKAYEASDAIVNGADELDMVINLGKVKEKEFLYVKREIVRLKKICVREGERAGRKILLKVIVETCLLTKEEKKKLCQIVTKAGADYIKTSTGFSTAGATKEDILLFKKYIGPNVKMKAAGGISSLEDAEDFLALGCERLGTSRLVKLAKAREEKE